MFKIIFTDGSEIDTDISTGNFTFIGKIANEFLREFIDIQLSDTIERIKFIFSSDKSEPCIKDISIDETDCDWCYNKGYNESYGEKIPCNHCQLYRDLGQFF